VEDIDWEGIFIEPGSNMFIAIVQYGLDSAVIVKPDDSGNGGFGGKKMCPKHLTNSLMSVFKFW
jgi:hypothetical protein